MRVYNIEIKLNNTNRKTCKMMYTGGYLKQY
jgi:hypothetical protein